jgi:putative Ca2+/H+ antiporter (TMEM165/GDT1 family)
MDILTTSFLLVAVSEMGDKTQLLAFALATRFKKPWPIMAGILSATVLNHLLAAWAGDRVSAAVGPAAMKWILALMFIGFGLWILRPDEHEDDGKPSTAGPYWATTASFFLAEMGDKTQLATAGLAAKFQSIAWVTAGTTLGMLASDGLAVFLGQKFSDKIPLDWVRRGAAALFILFGVAVLAGY